MAIVTISLTNTTSRPAYFNPMTTFLLRDQNGTYYAPNVDLTIASALDLDASRSPQSFTSDHYRPHNPNVPMSEGLIFELPYGLTELVLIAPSESSFPVRFDIARIPQRPQ